MQEGIARCTGHSETGGEMIVLMSLIGVGLRGQGEGKVPIAAKGSHCCFSDFSANTVYKRTHCIHGYID